MGDDDIAHGIEYLFIYSFIYLSIIYLFISNIVAFNLNIHIMQNILISTR